MTLGAASIRALLLAKGAGVDFYPKQIGGIGIVGQENRERFPEGILTVR